MAYYSTASRTIPHHDSTQEKFTTQTIFVDSLPINGAVVIPGRDLNNGFTVTLSNPIILNISNKYVISLIKAEFDTLALGTQYYDININTSLVQFQYENNKQAQLLAKIYKVKYDAAFYQTANPFMYQAINPINRYILSTTKVISQVSFTIDAIDRNGVVSPLPVGNYPTRLGFIIKMVPFDVQSVTII